MSGKAKPADSRRFSQGGKAGRGPGRGPWNLPGLSPTFQSPKPGMGFNSDRPPKGRKPPKGKH